MYCMKCGNQIPDDSTFCDNCGSSVEVPKEARGSAENTSPPKQPGYTVQPFTKEPKKKRSKAIIILSVITALSLVGCGVLGFVVADQAGTIAYKEKTIKGCYEVIDEKDRKINNLSKKSSFYDNYVVFGLNNSDKQYHKYDCIYFQNLYPLSKTIWVGLDINLRDEGFRPCQHCCK